MSTHGTSSSSISSNVDLFGEFDEICEVVEISTLRKTTQGDRLTLQESFQNVDELSRARRRPYSSLTRLHSFISDAELSFPNFHFHMSRQSRDLRRTKQQGFFFVSPFVLLLAYAWTMILCLCFCLWRSLSRRLDFIPLFCLLFSPYPYAYAVVWTRLKPRAEEKTKQRKILGVCFVFASPRG